MQSNKGRDRSIDGRRRTYARPSLKKRGRLAEVTEGNDVALTPGGFVTSPPPIKTY